jgi:hypothetical protein
MLISEVNLVAYNRPMPKSPRLGWIVPWILAVLLAGCLRPQTDAPRAALFTQTPAPPTFTATQTPTFTSIPAPTLTMSSTPTPEPAGCLRPPEEYTRVEINGWTINQRTLAMLTRAQELYGGELEINGHAITQGSYHDNGAASFGTHLGGGAVDLSVLQRGTYTVLWDDIEPLLRALRAAGFAAWLREYGELYADSPIHIHAIAIGDAELSVPAQDQLTGPAGYFRGYNGLPDSFGGPFPDRHGGPILCQWMIDLGYRDLR